LVIDQSILGIGKTRADTLHKLTFPAHVVQCTTSINNDWHRSWNEKQYTLPHQE